MAERSCILIVEDERDTAAMLTAYFESQGYEVLQAAWGQDALQIVSQTLPDLILLDIRLPDVDGYEVCRQLRQHRRTLETPIIFLTEKRERIDKLQGLELGAVDYITKPFDIQELKLRVRSALRRASFETLTDPVTGLPGEVLTRERLNGLLAQRGWALIGIQVTGLKAFSEAYGFVARDDALRALALMLAHISQDNGGEDAFIGHTGQAEFVIITSTDHVRDLCDRLVMRLKHSIEYFYPLKEEPGRATGKRPEIRIMLGTLSELAGPFANTDALLVSLRSAQQLV